MQEHAHVHEASLLPVLPLILLLAALGLYLVAAFWQRRDGRSWPAFRAASFLAGVVLLGVALIPSVHHEALVDIRVHMFQHLLIGMLAPIGLVLGAPMTLALKSLPKQVSRRVARVLHSRIIRALTHPLAALALNIGGMFMLYLTPLYAISLQSHPVHLLVHLHFLLAGYLFAWSIAGPDAAPGRPAFETRLAVLFVAIASHASLSKYLYAQILPRGTTHPEWQIRSAAKLMYYGGDLSELLLVVALYYFWMQRRTAAVLAHSGG